MRVEAGNAAGIGAGVFGAMGAAHKAQIGATWRPAHAATGGFQGPSGSTRGLASAAGPSACAGAGLGGWRCNDEALAKHRSLLRQRRFQAVPSEGLQGVRAHPCGRLCHAPQALRHGARLRRSPKRGAALPQLPASWRSQAALGQLERPHRGRQQVVSSGRSLRRLRSARRSLGRVSHPWTASPGGSVAAGGGTPVAAAIWGHHSSLAQLWGRPSASWRCGGRSPEAQAIYRTQCVQLRGVSAACETCRGCIMAAVNAIAARLRASRCNDIKRASKHSRALQDAHARIARRARLSACPPVGVRRCHRLLCIRLIQKELTFCIRPAACRASTTGTFCNGPRTMAS